MRYAKMPDSSENSDDSGDNQSSDEGGSGESESASSPSGSESDSDSGDDEETEARNMTALQAQLAVIQEQINQLQAKMTARILGKANNKKKKKEKKKAKKSTGPTRSTRRAQLSRSAKNEDAHMKDESAFDGVLNAANFTGLSAPGTSGQFPQSGFMANDASALIGNLGK